MSPQTRFALTVVLATAGVVAGCGPERAQRDLQPQADQRDPGPEATEDERPAIVFLGTSLTAGYGLSDPELAFPGLIQDRLDAEGLEYQVVNAGVSGDTSAGGLARLEYALHDRLDVLVLELGANDGLRGLDVDAMRANLDSILTRTRAAYPEARFVVAGMEAPPNLGRRYTDAFRAVFPELARRHDAVLVPFLLDGVAGDPGLNQGDGIHPTAEGHERVADVVWAALNAVVREEAGV